MNQHLFERAAPSYASEDDPLGPLADLPGTWTGKGLNVIGLPDFHDTQPFRVMVNATYETLTFERTGIIPNRGDSQDDIFLYGVTYLQQISDQDTSEGIHVEPGIWLNVPATTSPSGEASIVRQSSIPHGTTVLAQGTSYTRSGAPSYPKAPALAVPLPDGPPLKEGYNDPYYTGSFPKGYDPNDMNAPLLEVLKQQINVDGIRCLSNTALTVSTSPLGGISNIPFIKTNADAVDMKATFNIESMMTKDNKPFLQLQYTQTVNLIFGNIIWPHISVATLIKK